MKKKSLARKKVKRKITKTRRRKNPAFNKSNARYWIIDNIEKYRRDGTVDKINLEIGLINHFGIDNIRLYTKYYEPEWLPELIKETANEYEYKKIIRKNPLPFTEAAKFEKLRKEALKIGIYIFKASSETPYVLKDEDLRTISYDLQPIKVQDRFFYVKGYYYVDQKGNRSRIYNNLNDLASALRVEKIVYPQMKPWSW